MMVFDIGDNLAQLIVLALIAIVVIWPMMRG
jgi:hypothetical protein